MIINVKAHLHAAIDTCALLLVSLMNVVLNFQTDNIGPALL